MVTFLHLYSTSHCHLCEKAEALLIKLNLDNDIKWELIEITEDADLQERYEIKIPVLKRLDTSAEICWPFNEYDIKYLLSNIKAK